MKLKHARQLADMTQEEVAGYLGISRITYGKMERNPEDITLSDAKALSELFQVPFEDIFFDTNYSKTYSYKPQAPQPPKE